MMFPRKIFINRALAIKNEDLIEPFYLKRKSETQTIYFVE